VPLAVTTSTSATVGDSSARFFVTALNAQGSESLPSNLFDYVPGTVPTNQAPAAPTGVGLQLIGAKRIDVSWQSDPTAVTEVERSENGGAFVRVAETAPGVMHWSDNGVWKKNRYGYRLRSRNANGLSPYSNVVVFSPQ